MDFASMPLGLLPPSPARVQLRLNDYLLSTPTHPSSVDYFTNVAFGMYGNDKFGVCGPTSVANSRREVIARLKGTTPIPTQEDVFDLYRRSGNPQFNPATGADDNGVNMQVMLDALLRGGIGGVKPLGFAAVDVSDEEGLKAAVAIFGMLLYGVNLQVSQQAQTNNHVWDYVRSRPWGGHAILGGAYEANGLDVITWAQRVRMTDTFVNHQISEAWAVIWPEHLTDQCFLAGIDLAAFAAAYQAITGRTFPAVVPPPAPKPVPTGKITLVLSDPLPAGTYALTEI